MAFAAKQPRVLHDKEVYDADIVFASLGALFFEQTKYSKHNEMFKEVYGKYKSVYDIPFDDPDCRELLIRSFTNNYPELRKGRKIVLLNCLDFEDPGKTKRKSHTGLHPMTMLDIAKSEHFEYLCRKLKHLGENI